MFENSHTIFGGRNVYGGSGEFHGGDIEVFSGGYIEVIFGGGGNKVLRGKKPESRVQSPESRVQGPVRLLGYANFLCLWQKDTLLNTY